MSAESGKRILIRGAVWTVAMRWGIRALGLINTLVMARILMPSEYGIVAMASLVVGIIQSLLDFGAGTALLRKPKLDKTYIDSAWTLRILQGILIALVLLSLSPLASLYFSEPKVMIVLWALGACMMVSGFANIGLVLAQKNYDFSVEFKVYITAALVRVVVTISAGLMLRDYRALILGIVIGEIASTILSYAMHSYRPHWDTRKIREIWALTKWLMLSSTGRYILRRGDELIAGRLAGSAGEFGVYSVGSDLGQLPTMEVGPAMQRAVLPLLSSLSGPSKDVNAAVVKVVNAVNTVTWPLGLGLAALAGPFTMLLLGPNWTEAQVYIAGFAVVGALQSMPSAINTLLVLRGHTKQHGMTVWFELGAFVLTAVFLVPMFSLVGLVWARAIGAAVGFFRATMFACNLCELSLTGLLRGLWRPVLGALLMFLLVRWVGSHFDGSVEPLIIGSVIGGSFYLAWCLLTWAVSGCPDGLETMAVGWLKRAIIRRGS